MHVENHLDRSHELAVQRRPVEATERREGFETGGYLVRRIGVHGAGTAVVPGVQSRQEVDDLRSAHFPDDDSVGSHAQRLPDEVADGDLPDAFHIGCACDQPDDVWVCGYEFGSILDADDPLPGIHGSEQGREQRRLHSYGPMTPRQENGSGRCANTFQSLGPTTENGVPVNRPLIISDLAAGAIALLLFVITFAGAIAALYVCYLMAGGAA